MPITGAWKNQVQIQAGPLIWGTGWNPIHAHPNYYGGRNVAPNEGQNDPAQRDFEIIDLNAPYVTWETDGPSESIWGYGTGTGTSDRPRLGQDHDQTAGGRDNLEPWPPKNINGDHIRSVDRGAEQQYITKRNFQDEALNGWVNKEVTEVTDAKPSPESYEMQTSMRQRDKVRGPSQTSGRASKYSLSIASRIIGEKLKTMVGSPERLSDMFPRQQAFMVRPFWERSAGTDLAVKMRPNAMYESVPLQRIPPADPYQGPEMEGSTSGFYDSGSWMVSYS